ncbi:MAG: restriction endonuclease subunit S [Vescimonas sp.]|uniref:restriction endonuclease subunit S n=1 Tax=Vescimonas sp. TaxID=2892404 RepID=UPI002A909F37|nr:restriction endonuclease subunit S [Vescimonas sp.]MDY5334567.1 restriction endonuclease subunit S [Vescimonas sp.]
MAEYKTLVKKIPVSPDKKTKQKDYLKKGRLPIVDQGQSLVGGYTDDADMAVKCELPVIVFGDHTRAVKYITFPFGAGADGIKVLQPKENILPLFLYYATQYIVAKMPNRGYARHYQYVEKEDLPVPPLPEQERIVARIEELFSQLDAGVETLKKTKAQLAVYRQAVLKEAFSSELSSKTVEIREIVDDIRIGPFGTMLHKSDYISGGVPVINPQHIKSGKILPSASVTVSEEKARDLSAYRLQTNDIIMGRRGEMGRAAAITDVENGWLCGTGSILFRLKPNFDAGFYAQILSSPDVVHYLEEHATGTTMKNLNEDIVQYIPVPFVTAEMQRDITVKMDCKMSVCDSIEHTVDLALQQAEAMRQSILKNAFEGRL